MLNMQRQKLMETFIAENAHNYMCKLTELFVKKYHSVPYSVADSLQELEIRTLDSC